MGAKIKAMSLLQLKQRHRRQIIARKEFMRRAALWVWVDDEMGLDVLGCIDCLLENEIDGDDWLGHLCTLPGSSWRGFLCGGLAQYAFVQFHNCLPNRITWLGSYAPSKLADGCLPTAAISGNLHLTKPGVLNVFDELIPVHAPIISAYRYLVNCFLSVCR